MNRDSDSPENPNVDGASSEPTSQPAPDEQGSDANPLAPEPPADAPAPEPSSEPGESATSAGSSSEAPQGLEPSPGLQPPSGIYAPQPPEPQAPEAPQFGQQQPAQPAWQQDQQYGKPQQPYAQAPHDQQPYQSAPQYQPQPGQYPASPNGYPAQDPQQAQWAEQGAAHPQQYAPAGGGQPPRKGLSKGALWGIIGGGAGLLLIIILVIVFMFAGRGSGGGLGLLGGGESPSESVESYLKALADGDAETAAGYLDTYGESSMLTDEVLEKSNELAPIADVVVGESQETQSDVHTVEASFTLGGETVERTFEVWTIGDTIIYDGATSFSNANFDGLGLTINGAEVASDSVYLFPGAYELALEVEEFEVQDQTEPLILATENDREKVYQLMPTLTEEATQTFRDLVTASLNECIASKSLSTDCGMDVSGFDQDGYTAIDGTVTRSLTAEGTSALKSLTVSPSYEVPTVVSSTDYIAVDMTLEAESSSGKAQFELLWGGDLGTPSVDFSDENPSVTWD